MPSSNSRSNLLPLVIDHSRSNTFSDELRGEEPGYTQEQFKQALKAFVELSFARVLDFSRLSIKVEFEDPPEHIVRRGKRYAAALYVQGSDGRWTLRFVRYADRRYKAVARLLEVAMMLEAYRGDYVGDTPVPVD